MSREQELGKHGALLIIGNKSVRVETSFKITDSDQDITFVIALEASPVKKTTIPKILERLLITCDESVELYEFKTLRWTLSIKCC